VVNGSSSLMQGKCLHHQKKKSIISFLDENERSVCFLFPWLLEILKKNSAQLKVTPPA
jgi:hypothetical protein